MITVRKSEERGHADFGWLDSRHSFSFGEYRDPEHMGFRALRVINDDRVAAGKGFGSHPHRDMEIVSYVVDGAVAHKDSLGNGSVIRPGDVQRMTAGTGVTHSEFNPSEDEETHFLQIWIIPEAEGLEPGYEQKNFPEDKRAGSLCLVASPDGGDGSVRLHQDARIYASILERGQEVAFAPAPGRGVWVQVVAGEIAVNGVPLGGGDGAAIEDEDSLRIVGVEKAEFLVFDLA